MQVTHYIFRQKLDLQALDATNDTNVRWTYLVPTIAPTFYARIIEKRVATNDPTCSLYRQDALHGLRPSESKRLRELDRTMLKRALGDYDSGSS